MNNLDSLYETDFSTWASRNAELLRLGRFTEIDLKHLLEELTTMGTSERNELENRLVILLAHLLKWQYQYPQLAERWREFKGDSWRDTIIEQRNRIANRLKKSPGLKSKLTGIIAESYQDAIDLAAKESRLPATTFPSTCPYSWEQIINDDFYPI